MDGGSPDAGVADAGSKDAGAAQDGGSQSDGGATDAGAPYFVSIATASNLLANSMTINVPAGAQSGDLLLAVLTFGETTNMTAPVITVPTGWTQVRRIDQGTTSTLAVYYHPVQPGEPSSYTWTTDLQAKGVEWIACYRQASGSPPVDVETAVAQGAGTTFVTPALTTTAPNTLIVASFGGLSQTQPSTWMLPSGVASQANFNDGELRSGLDLESPMPAPGPVPTFSVTTSQVQASVLIDVLALQP